MKLLNIHFIGKSTCIIWNVTKTIWNVTKTIWNVTNTIWSVTKTRIFQKWDRQRLKIVSINDSLTREEDYQIKFDTIIVTTKLRWKTRGILSLICKPTWIQNLHLFKEKASWFLKRDLNKQEIMFTTKLEEDNTTKISLFI